MDTKKQPDDIAYTMDLWNMELESSFVQEPHCSNGSVIQSLDEPVEPDVVQPPAGNIKKFKESRKRKKSYSEDFLKSILSKVRDGTMTKYHAQKFYGIPRGTLQYRLSEHFQHEGRTGPDSLLSTSEETIIVSWLQVMEKRGFPITRKGLASKVAAYLRKHPRDNLSRNYVPGAGNKRCKNVPFVENQNGKQNVTVLFTFSADGTIIPPDVILPYKRLSRDIVQSFPSEWGLGTSDSGWMNSSNFTLYIKKILYPALVKTNVKFPVCYFVDGHKSHTAVEAADACSELGIILIALYPNATRILQPADVSIFRPLKNSWGKVVEIWRTDNMAERLSIPTFGALFQETMKSAFKISTIINAFRVCGLFPFNPDAVDYSKCISTSISHLRPVPHSSSACALPVDTEPMTLVPTAAIENALRLIGSEKAEMFKSGDQNLLSSEGQILNFIYHNILTLGQPDRNDSEQPFNALNDIDMDYEAAINEPIIILEDDIEGELNFNSFSYLENREPVMDNPADAAIIESDVDENDDLQPTYYSFPPESLSATETPHNELDLRSSAAFDDISNFPESHHVNAQNFFEAPPTPKRNPKHRFYKQKSHAILTAGERLEEIQLIESKRLKQQN
ncbi:uncharacterized protein LOC134207390 [Armigeres subalbatus]|uniref:uncharacterized protein LOC134207390 n=1 Tax=Armigeres subalbatus TaxID=124917 RepID=UPI002ED67FBD